MVVICVTVGLQVQVGSQTQDKSLRCFSPLCTSVRIVTSSLWIHPDFWIYLCASFISLSHFVWFPEAFLDLGFFFFFATVQKNGSFWSSDVVAQLGPAACGLRDSWVASSWCKTNTKRLSGETRADTSVCMTISWSGVISCCVCWRQEMTPKLPKYKHLSFSLSHVLVNWIYLGFWLLVRQKKDCENI